MDATLTPTLRRIRIPSPWQGQGRRGLELSVREWPGEDRPFLLVHGLASNARTWDGVGECLSAAGHRAISVDQRGHGLSDKPDTGYGFDEVTEDLKALIEELGLEKPVVAGQSWGGNVVLDLAARYPELTAGIVLVDGGFIDLSARPDGDWEKIAVDLKPPALAGMPRDQMLDRMRGFHPDWTEDQIEMQMGNFETLPDSTIRPWLTLDRHMQILRALWEQHPADLYPRVRVPTLIAVADVTPARRGNKDEEVARAEAGIADVRVSWFEDSVHDIHVQRPAALTEWMLSAFDEGYFG